MDRKDAEFLIKSLREQALAARKLSETLYKRAAAMELELAVKEAPKPDSGLAGQYETQGPT